MENSINAKRFQNFAKKQEMEVYFMCDNNLCIRFEDTETHNEEAYLVYGFAENQSGLFYRENTGIENLEDMPRWIEDIEQLRNVVKYVSKEGK